MRICVDRYGDRMDSAALGVKVHDINVLTVIASESYRTFVSDLQSDLKSELYTRPDKATKEYFSGKHVKVGGALYEVSKADAAYIERYLGFNHYIDYDGNVSDEYREAAAAGTLAPLPKELAHLGDGVHKLVQSIFDDNVLRDMISYAGRPALVSNDLNENFKNEEFQKLWKLINHRYAYTVDFDSAELVRRAAAAINKELFVTDTVYVRTVGSQNRDDLDFSVSGTKVVAAPGTGGADIEYDLIAKICAGTMLTRATVAAILKSIDDDKLALFAKAPEEFIAKTVAFINETKAELIVDNISYNISSEPAYPDSVFAADISSGAADRAVLAKRHVTPYVIVDSKVERDFVAELEADEDNVFVYAKLPRAFKIPTPVGDYTPDWAIVFKTGSTAHVNFVTETKGSTRASQLKGVENAKLRCAAKLFEKLFAGAVRYDVVDSFAKLLDKVNS